METYDILFKDAKDTASKGFNIKDKDKAIRMATDMLTSKKGFVTQFPGGTISVIVKQTNQEVWSQPIPKE